MGARTGQAYIEGLRDGRHIYVNGELVPDVTQYPPFQGVIRTLPARIYTIVNMIRRISRC